MKNPEVKLFISPSTLLPNSTEFWYVKGRFALEKYLFARRLMENVFGIAMYGGAKEVRMARGRSLAMVQLWQWPQPSHRELWNEHGPSELFHFEGSAGPLSSGITGGS